jgi:Peptidase M15
MLFWGAVALLAAPTFFTLSPFPAFAGFSMAAASGAAPPFSSGKVGFSIRYKDEISSYYVNGVFVRPEDTIFIEVLDPGTGQNYTAEASGGSLTQESGKKWRWTAPARVGLYPLQVRRVQGETITLNTFVLVPYEKVRNELLNGYRIGAYPSVPLHQLPIYNHPAGFIEAAPEMLDTPVSPHFKLGQFLCKQEGAFPKYLVLQERLLLKLELILQQVNAKGFRSDTLYVMSGYRTPFYNKAIGNVPYSRHVWGGAADIFVDQAPPDGVMDDLNRDGVLDQRDATVLHDLIDDLQGKPFYAAFLGGLAGYRATPAHGPFVHVDERGFRARWGI